jgi:hypothetical protein
LTSISDHWRMSKAESGPVQRPTTNRGRWTSFVAAEDGRGWTTLALDRATRAWSLAQRDSQLDAATSASGSRYA